MLFQEVLSASRKVTFALLWLIFIGGCSRSSSPMNAADLKLKNALIGTWVRQTDVQSGMVILSPDGTIKSGWTNGASHPVHSWQYEGYWTVTGGVCFVTRTKSESVGTTNKGPLGIESWKIVSVDAESLVSEIDGHTNSLIRKR
jgi:hypothetical protein